MLMRYAENIFSNNYLTSIGVDFVYYINLDIQKKKTITMDQKQVKLQIWDIADNNKERALTRSYYKGAHGIIIVYDITDRESFETVKTYMNEIDE